MKNISSQKYISQPKIFYNKKIRYTKKLFHDKKYFTTENISQLKIFHNEKYLQVRRDPEAGDDDGGRAVADQHAEPDPAVAGAGLAPPQQQLGHQAPADLAAVPPAAGRRVRELQGGLRDVQLHHGQVSPLISPPQLWHNIVKSFLTGGILIVNMNQIKV